MEDYRVISPKEVKSIIEKNEVIMKNYNSLVIACNKLSIVKIKEADEKYELLYGNADDYFPALIKEFKEYFATYNMLTTVYRKELPIINYLIGALLKDSKEDF